MARAKILEVKPDAMARLGRRDDDPFAVRKPACRHVADSVFLDPSRLACSDGHEFEKGRWIKTGATNRPPVVRREGDRATVSQSDRRGPIGASYVRGAFRSAPLAALREENEPSVARQILDPRCVEPRQIALAPVIGMVDDEHGSVVDVSHDERDPPGAEIHHAMHADDVGMIELRDEARFASEARDRLFVLDVLRTNQLDRDLLAGGAIPRQIDDSRPATPDLPEYPVLGFERGEGRRSAFAAHCRTSDGNGGGIRLRPRVTVRGNAARPLPARCGRRRRADARHRGSSAPGRSLLPGWSGKDSPPSTFHQSRRAEHAAGSPCSS